MAALLELGVDRSQNTAMLEQFMQDHPEEPNIRIVGKGSGVSLVDGDIVTRRWRPSLEAFTIFGTVTLENPGEPWMSDVWIHPQVLGSYGLTIRTVDDPANQDSGWPVRGKEVPAARHTLGNYFGVHILAWDGWDVGANINGILLESSATAGLQGEFINHFYHWGGHIAVRGLAFNQKIANTNVWGMHIDSGKDNDLGVTEGLRLGEGATADWFAAGVEPGSGMKGQCPIGGEGADNFRSWGGKKDETAGPHVGIWDALYQEYQQPALPRITSGYEIDFFKPGTVYQNPGTYLIPDADLANQTTHFTIANSNIDGGVIRLEFADIADRLIFPDGSVKTQPFESSGKRGEFITLKNTNYRDWTVQAIGGDWRSVT